MARSFLYPPIEPFDRGWLAVSGGHRVYYEQCGNPKGAAAVFVHGGPGSGCNPAHRRFFDPRFYRIILFDQRGSGRSRPLGLTRANTTALLISDMEQLRRQLGVEKWLVFGGSWGSTLGLAYAQAHPRAVPALILRGIFLASRRELDWFLHGLNDFVPDAWEKFAGAAKQKFAGAAQARKNLLAYYHRRVNSLNGGAALRAARAWSNYEAFLLGLGRKPAKRKPEAGRAAIGRVRIQTHYLMHRCFLRPNQLLRRINRVRAIPAFIVQGRYDMLCPPITAYALHAAWPKSELRLVEGAGHSAFDPHMAQALVQATVRFKTLLARKAK